MQLGVCLSFFSALSSCIRTYSVARQVILDWEWPSLAARWIKKLSRAQEKPDTLSESSTGNI